MRRFILGVLLTISACLALSASAHPRQEAETIISLNPNTDKVEIVHKFRLVDAEDAVQEGLGSGESLTDSDTGQAWFGAYVEDAFRLRRNGGDIPLEFVGGEIEHGYVWIYQQAEALPKDGLYILQQAALLDVHDAQVNIIHVRLGDNAQDFLISRARPWVSFRLDGASVFGD